MKSRIARVAAMAAVTGLAFGSAALLSGCQQDGSSGGTAVEKTSAGHECKGANACKGTGGCKTGDAGCKGKNSCKGKGGCKVAH